MFTVFQPKRTKDKNFAGWSKSVPGNVYQAYCSTCRKNLRIPVEYDGDHSSRITLGQHQTQTARRCHADFEYITILFSRHNRNEYKECVSLVYTRISCCDSFFHTFISRCKNTQPKWLKGCTSTLKSLWAMRTVSCHDSYKSNDDIKKIFRVMFPDSELLKYYWNLE